jgi:hypothetical protein
VAVRLSTTLIESALAPPVNLIDQWCMRTLSRIESSARNREGWIELPLLIRGLQEAQRVVVETTAGRFIVGHTVRSGIRWWFVPDWRVSDPDDLALYEVS